MVGFSPFIFSFHEMIDDSSTKPFPLNIMFPMEF